MEPDRPPHHRRHQRRAHDADGPRDARLGRRAARRDGRPAGDAARRSGRRWRSTARPRGDLAGLPVAAALGDQHAALFGQLCFEFGDAKCTYGTGSFLLVNTGSAPVHTTNGLLATVGYKVGDEPATYALEGSIADDRRAGAVAAGQHRADRQRVRDRDARPHRGGQRRLLRRPGVLRAVRPALAQRRPRRDRGPDGLHHQGPPGAGRAGGDGVADARRRRGDERGRRRAAAHAQGRRRHDRQQPADAVARRRARRAGRAADRRRDARARRGLRGRPRRRLLARRRRPARATGTRPRSGYPAMEPAERERLYRKWRKAVRAALEWVDDDD